MPLLQSEVILAGVPAIHERDLMLDYYYNRNTRAITISPPPGLSLQSLCMQTMFRMIGYKYHLILEKDPKGRYHWHGLVKCRPQLINNLKQYLTDSIGFTRIDVRAGKAWYKYMYKDVARFNILPLMSDKYPLLPELLKEIPLTNQSEVRTPCSATDALCEGGPRAETGAPERPVDPSPIILTDNIK